METNPCDDQTGVEPPAEGCESPSSDAESSHASNDLELVTLPASCQKAVQAYVRLRHLLEAADPTSETYGLPAPNESSSLCQELIEICELLLERNRRRTAAWAAASHQLKTPLAVMASYADLLLSGKTGPLFSRQWQIVEDFRVQCQRLQKVVSDFLVYAGIEGATVTLRYVLADLNLCLSELHQFWAPQFRREGLTFSFVPSPRPEILRFDYDKMQHVVSNLLENALQATPAGGTVRLEIKPRFWDRRRSGVAVDHDRRRTAAADQPNAVEVSVSDTGPGIAPEHHLEIFEAFFKLSEDDRRPQSLGLGLRIAQLLIRAHNGKIWVESQPGAGAKFSFLLPLDLEPQDSSAVGDRP